MKPSITVRNTRPLDFEQVIDLCRRVYEGAPPWHEAQLQSHLRVFPEGQFVAEDRLGRIVGMAASLIIRWDDYQFDASWRDFTDAGMFTNHDPQSGRTLYGAEVMVDPALQGSGVGRSLYKARRRLAERLGLLRIRAAARLRSYHLHAEGMSAREYVQEVVRGNLKDPTLSFQLKQGFKVIAVVDNYLLNDPESRGYAAVIEWRNTSLDPATDTKGATGTFHESARNLRAAPSSGSYPKPGPTESGLQLPIQK